MTDLFEKAAGASGGPPIVLARDLAEQGVGTLRGFDLEAADDLTPEGQFPEYGDFLSVWVEGDEAWWECPATLAGMIAEEVEKAGEPEPEDVRVDVDMAAKNSAGEWQFVADVSIESE